MLSKVEFRERAGVQEFVNLKMQHLLINTIMFPSAEKAFAAEDKLQFWRKQ